MIDSMDLSDMLLHEALVARDTLADLQDEVDRRRLVYYQAVRRLHFSGASMRDIAEALGLSHQRVHQIVNGGEQMASSKPAKNLLHRLVRRSGNEGEPGRKPPDPGSDPFDRFYVDARTAMSRAQDEARAFNHHYIGTEHLLLGLLRTEHGLAARLLTATGIDIEETRRAIEALVGRGETTPPDQTRVTPRLKKVLELARQEAKNLRSSHVRSEHVLLGLAREGGGLGARLLAEHGVAYEQLRARVDRAALACSFCGRSGLDVAHLIAGPGVYICDECTADASRLAGEGDIGTLHAPLSVVTEDLAATCSFCGKHQPDVDRLIAGPGALICTDCLTICREIQAEIFPR
jgi:AcrR family transcriptional regulator